MHGWPAVADLTSGRPIRIALVQVGAAPTAQAHCKLSQQISQQSDPFLCSLRPRGAPIAWLVFRTGLFCLLSPTVLPSTRATSIRVTSFLLTWITQVWHRTCGVMSSRLAQAFNVAQVVLRNDRMVILRDSRLTRHPSCLTSGVPLTDVRMAYSPIRC